MNITPLQKTNKQTQKQTKKQTKTKQTNKQKPAITFRYYRLEKNNAKYNMLLP